MDNQQTAIRTTIVVPAYNEEKGLGLVLGELFKVVDDTYEILVVDDGSTDRTPEVARQFPCRLIQHPGNRGKGEALKTGIREARGEVVLWIDADGTYPVAPISQMACALHGSYDLVFTSRRDGRKRIPTFNRFGNALFRWSIRGAYGFRPQDPCSGLCGVRKEHLARMNLRAGRFAIEPEIAMKAGRMKLRMLDVPIEYRARVGEPKLNPIKAGIEDSLAILGHLWWRPNPLVFLLSGSAAFLTGVLLMVALMRGPVVLGPAGLTLNSYILAAMLAIGGAQMVVLGLAADLYVSGHGLRQPRLASRAFLHRHVGGNLGRVSMILVVSGLGMLAWLGYQWVSGGFAGFPWTKLMVLGSLLTVLGIQCGFSSSFLTFFAAELSEAHRMAGRTINEN